MPATRARNDPEQYDDLVAEWWRPRGVFAMLHWIAASRAELIPEAGRPGAILLDIACGGGVMGPYVGKLGYRHVGADIGFAALIVAREHGVQPVQADAARLPFADGAADVVVAGEMLEHVRDLRAVVAELCRVLAPGGTLVVDALADTALSRLVTVTLAERIPGGPPVGLHDPALYVSRGALIALCAEHGVRLRLRGLRPSIPAWVGWLVKRREAGRMVATRSTAVLFTGVGTKAGR
ncbi:MAG: 2-polyprenyl-6-hydroxyphenyl methylase / 3-demethylubiquinone-9 3-methyltransferase [Frankiales bacterium]|jgi:2-polyprenyl-6-hydroxyphenyl methylase/3-demethylubiquinone-9 3-methyltransferase|nr:2-polyprenyl-6-hydroxyphenyl methylase / 3-demethylubiquinone-9 3-methyltransferase [Frankiales bacterium]